MDTGDVSADEIRRQQGEKYAAMLASTNEDRATSAAAVRLGDAMRAFTRAAVGSSAPDEVFERVAGVIEQLTAELAPHAQPSRYEQADRLLPGTMFANHPMIGPANTNSPRIVMEPAGERLVGHVTFGTPQEGPPNCAYGGYIAAGFDAILLMTAGINGLGGPTKSMNIRYRKATPLNQPLQYVGEIASVDERVTRIVGKLMSGDVVCAEAVGEAARTALRHA